ncbi:MAG: hypothetical protein J6U86_05530 [Clostridia bacterium]|nr:hypothetical protein [Clostridia bacterium]
MSQNEIPALGTDKISEAVGKLLENPSLLQSVASALGLGGEGGEKATASDTHEAASVEAVAGKHEVAEASASSADMSAIMASVLPMLSKLASGGGDCRHEKLLFALKPYLSPSRSSAVDYIVKISKMSELVKGLGR